MTIPKLTDSGFHLDYENTILEIEELQIDYKWIAHLITNTLHVTPSMSSKSGCIVPIFRQQTANFNRKLYSNSYAILEFFFHCIAALNAVPDLLNPILSSALTRCWIVIPCGLLRAADNWRTQPDRLDSLLLLSPPPPTNSSGYAACQIRSRQNLDNIKFTLRRTRSCQHWTDQ